MNILLDYFFPVTAISPTPQASTAFLKQACLVVKPAAEVETGVITLCTTLAQVEALTDNTEAAQLLAGGLSRVYILPMDNLGLAEVLEEAGSDFYTLIISSDFTDEEVIAGTQVITPEVKASVKIQDILYTAKGTGTAGNAVTISYIEDAATGNEALVSVTDSAIVVDIDAAATTAATVAAAIAAFPAAHALVGSAVDLGDETDVQAVTGSPVSLAGGANVVTDEGSGLDVGLFKGVVGLASNDTDFLEDQAVIENRCAFYTSGSNGAKNLCFAFGKLLSNSLNWLNQQYITMPFADDVATLGTANFMFDEKISFVLSDSEFGSRLGLLACGGKAIVAPYIVRNLEIDVQSSALSYISGNQPSYSKTQAALLEDELQKVFISYIERQWIEAGVVEVKLEQSNFVASAYMNISEPKALWRIFGELRQTL